MPQLTSLKSFLFALVVASVLSACGSNEGSLTNNTASPSSRTAPQSATLQPKTLMLSGDVGLPGDTLYLSFDMPSGIQRIDLAFADGSPTTKLGLGLFDQRGTAFLDNGFRGIAGEERRSAFIDVDDATPGFVAGDLPVGRYTVVVPNFQNVGGTAIVSVKLTPTRKAVSRPISEFFSEPAPELVTDKPGWYKGDLHVHTTFSSDAFSSKAALTPSQMAKRAQGLGLNFIALTDHNVIDQNSRMLSDSPLGFLLLGGMEVTTWVGGPGHLIVAGLQSGEFVDWRFRPRYGRYARTFSWKPDDRPIQDVLDFTRKRGIFSSAAHPYVAPGLGSDWGFFNDSDIDPNALPDSMEVWNDDFRKASGELTLKQWDLELTRNRKVCGNGGSDIHGIGKGTFDGQLGDNNPANINEKLEVGNPTTVVWAESLSRKAITASLRRCRAYITAHPKGPGLVLNAEDSQGAKYMMGDTVIGQPQAQVQFSATVTGGKGLWLMIIRNGAVVATSQISSDEQTVMHTQPLAGSGALRAELRQGNQDFTLPMALSNPIFIRSTP